MWGVPGPPVPGILCVPPGLLREGPQPPGQGPEENSDSGQLTCVLHLPPRECSEWSLGTGSVTGWDYGLHQRSATPSVAQQPPGALAREGRQINVTFPATGARAVLV